VGIVRGIVLQTPLALHLSAISNNAAAIELIFHQGKKKLAALSKNLELVIFSGMQNHRKNRQYN